MQVFIRLVKKGAIKAESYYTGKDESWGILSIEGSIPTGELLRELDK